MAGIGMAVPIMLPLEITAIVCRALGMSAKFRRRKLKAQKHYKNKTTCRQQVKFHLKFTFQIHKRSANIRTGIGKYQNRNLKSFLMNWTNITI